MANFVALELDGQIVRVQIDEPESRLRGTRGGGEGNSDEVKGKFTDALGVIAPVGNALLKSLKGINTPDEINLEFGFTFTGEAGVVFTSVKSEARFNVKLVWKNPPQTTAPV